MLKRATEPTANLLCLATFAKLVSGRPLPSSTWSCGFVPDATDPVSSQSSPPDDIFATARSFFAAKRAGKTADLVLLNCILSCKEDSTRSNTQNIENLNLAKVVLDSINDENKTLWAQSHSPILKKYYDKLSKPSLTLKNRLKGVEIAISLVGARSVPGYLVETLEQQLRRQDSQLEEATELDGITTLFSQEFLQSYLVKSLELCINSSLHEYDDFVAMKQGILLLEGTRVASKSCLDLREKILLLLSTNTTRRALQDFLECTNDAGSRNSEDQLVCPGHLAFLRADLRRAICRLFLTSAMFASSDGLGLDASLANRIMEKHNAISSINVKCWSFQSTQSTKSTNGPPSTLTKSLDFPCAPSNWREWLENELEQNAKRDHALLIQRIGEVCKSIEMRCEEVEGPLQQEKERSAKAQDKLIRLEADNSRLVADNEFLRSQENEMLDQLKAKEDLSEQQRKEIGRLRDQLRKEKLASAEAIKSASETAQHQELEYLATNTAKDQMIEEQRNALNNQIEICTELKGTLESAQQEAQLQQYRTSDLQLQLTSLREEEKVRGVTLDEKIRLLAASDEAVAEFGKEIDRINESKAVAQRETERLKQDLENLRLEIDASMAQHSDGVKAIKGLVCKVRTQHGEELSKMETDVIHQKHGHDEAILALQRDLDIAKAETLRVSEAYEQKVTELNGAINKLTKEREKQSREFAEAQDLSRKLIAIMGHNSSTSGSISVKSHPGEEISMNSAGSGTSPGNESMLKQTSNKRLRGSQQPYYGKPRAEGRSSFSSSPSEQRRLPLQNLNPSVQRSRTRKNTQSGFNKSKYITILGNSSSSTEGDFDEFPDDDSIFRGVGQSRSPKGTVLDAHDNTTLDLDSTIS